MIEIFNKKLFEWLEKMDIEYFLSLSDRRDAKKLDVAIVEGAITTQRDLREIKEVRAMTDVLIGMGNCTITGMPTCQRNTFNEEQRKAIEGDLEKFAFLEKCMPVKEVVKMDDEVPGCPMDEKKFIEVLEKYL